MQCCSMMLVGLAADTAMTKSSNHEVTALIAACGFRTTAPGVENASFTHALVNVLTTALKESRRLPISELYSDVQSKLRNTPARKRQTTPVHCSLTSGKTGRRIIIESLKRDKSKPQLQFADKHTKVVTVSLRMDEDVDVGSWAEWILNAPSQAIDVLLTRVGVAPW